MKIFVVIIYQKKETLSKLKEVFPQKNFQLYAVQTLDQAIEKIEIHIPHVLMVEISFGDEEEARNRFRWPEKIKTGAFASLFTIALSHTCLSQQVLLAKKAGYDDYILTGGDKYSLMKKIYHLRKKLEQRKVYQIQYDSPWMEEGQFTVSGNICGISDMGICVESKIWSKKRQDQIEYITPLFEQMGVPWPLLSFLDSRTDKTKAPLSIYNFFLTQGWQDSDLTKARKWAWHEGLGPLEFHFDKFEEGPKEILVVDPAQYPKSRTAQEIQQLFPPFQIHIVSSLQAGLSVKPDLIVYLGALPLDQVGSEELRLSIKNLMGETSIPLLLVTDQAPFDLLISFRELGPVDFIGRPLDPWMLKAKIETLLSGKFMSPFPFLGKKNGLSPIHLTFNMGFREVSEEGVEIYSPVLAASGGFLEMTLGGLCRHFKVEDCYPCPKHQDFYRVRMKIQGELDEGEMRKLREFILALKKKQELKGEEGGP